MLAAIPLLAAAVVAGTVLWRWRMRQHAYRLAVETAAGETGALLIDPDAQLVAGSSAGVSSRRCAGTLALGPVRLVFVSAALRHPIDVEREQIRNIAVARAHLGVEAERALLVVEWDHNENTGSAAWIVTDLPRWLTSL